MTYGESDNVSSGSIRRRECFDIYLLKKDSAGWSELRGWLVLQEAELQRF